MSGSALWVGFSIDSQAATAPMETETAVIHTDLETARRLVETAQRDREATAADGAGKGQGRWARLQAEWRGA